MKAMIFAAGLGTRLGDLTRDRPKALVDVNGRSALRLAVEKLADAGFDDLIVNIHHHPALMREEIERLRSDGFRITISDETALLLDTGGGLFNARSFFGEVPFICYNVDIFTDLDISDLYQKHLDSGALATLAVRHRPGNRFFLVERSGRIRGWRNVASKEEIITVNSSKGLEEIAFSGIHVLSPEILEMMPEGIYTMTSVYLLLAGRHRIMTYLHDQGYWFDCGTPQNLKKIRKQLGSEN